MSLKALTIRINEELVTQIKLKSELDNITQAELITRAITEYLYKDINIQNELLGMLTQTNKNVKKCHDEYNLFYAFMIECIKYLAVIYNATMQSIHEPGDVDGNSNESKLLKHKAVMEAEKRLNTFMEHFRKDSRHLVGLVQTLFADVITEEA